MRNANESDVVAEMATPETLFSNWLKCEVWEDYRHDLRRIAEEPREEHIRLMLMCAFKAGFRKGVHTAHFD